MRTKQEIKEAIALMDATAALAGEQLVRSEKLVDEDVRRGGMDATLAKDVLQWIMTGKSEFVDAINGARKEFPDLVVALPAQPPEPMRFSEAVSKFEAMCDASEQCKGKYRTIGFEHCNPGPDRMKYSAYIADVLRGSVYGNSLLEILGKVDAKLNPPAVQDVAAELEAVDVEALARLDDGGGLPEPAVFDSAEEDAAQVDSE